jgi:NADH-quinone oxidoreductase subunit B
VPILVLALLAVGFAVFSVVLGTLTGPKRWNRAKLQAYESGIEPTPQPPGGGRFPVKYYLTAMLFIVFDIEIVFLYPWAVSYDQLGVFGAGRDGHVHRSPSCRLRLCLAPRRPGRGISKMGLEEKLPSGFLLTTVEKLAGYARKSSVWPATFGLACCAIELMQTGGPRHDLARFGMERFPATPRQADLMIVAGRVSQKMAPVLRQIYDQMAEPKWVISMGVCASSGGMFNNYAIVQGVDHIVPVDIYLPGCPPRPEMLLDAILKLHDKIQNMKLGVNRERHRRAEQAAAGRVPLHR